MSMAEDGEDTGVAMATTEASLARARDVKWWSETGRICAAALRQGSYQIEAAYLSGLKESNYYRALEGESDEHVAFQREVLPALFEQARAAEEQAEKDIFGGGQHSAPAVNWWKWKLEKRYRKLFGDMATKVELSGPNGGPVQSEATVRYVIAVPPEEKDDE